MSAKRPNFYELLELDPSLDDWDEIRKKLEKQKKLWNQVRTQRTGHKRAEAEAKLGWLDEMVRVLSDPALRRQEAEARRQQLDAARRDALNELDRRIETLRSLGGCSEEQLAKLTVQFKGRLERAEIEARLRDAGVKVGAGAKAEPFETRDFLGDAELKEIQHGLAVLRLPDLYVFLEATPATPPERLVELADKRYKASLGQVDERATAVQKLAGICQNLFRKPGGKELYNASAATVAMRQLHGDIDLLVEDGQLRYEAFELLARAAAEHGVDPGLARSYVGWYASKRGWSIAEPSEQGASPNLEQLMRQMEATLKRVEDERRRSEERWAEERRRMEEAAKAAAQSPPPVPVSTAPVSSPPVPHALEAPSSLHVEPIRGGFRLQWPQVVGDGIAYWVVRKRDGYPQDEGDGEMCQEVSTPSFEDVGLSQNGPWFYAVFTLRHDETSGNAALSGPHRIRRGSAGRKAAVAAIIASIGVAAALILLPPQKPKKPKKEATPTPVVQPVTPLPPPPPELPPPKPKPIQTLPLKPKVAVLGAGDHQIVPVVEDKLIRELSLRGFEVVGRNGLIRLDDHLDRGGRASLSQLMSGTSLDGIDVLVHAQVDRVGERELRFLGRSETAISSRVGVQTYLVADQKPLGPEWSEQFEYTQVNLAKKLEESVYGLGGDVLKVVESGWSDYRKRRGLNP